MTMTTHPDTADTLVIDERPAPRSLWSKLGRDTLYLLTGFPIALLSFVVLVTGLSLGVGLFITLAGLPILVLVLGIARGFATIERWRVGQVAAEMPPAPYRPVPAETKLLRRWFGQLRDTQSWLDVLHGLVVLPVAVVTFSITLVWWTGALSGLTFWFWSRYLPENADRTDLASLLDLPISEGLAQALLGLAFALTLIPVLRGCAAAQAGLAGALLGNSHVVALQDRVSTLTASRAAGAQAEVDALRRLERDLHDGPQQRLVRLGMDLAAAERRLADDDPAQASQILAEARTQSAEALAELRALTRGIAPPILCDRGLPDALAALAGRSGVPTWVDVELPGERPSAAAETAAYFVVSECLTNVAKHSGAANAWVKVRRDSDELVVEITDDGSGGAAAAKGHGLAGLADRVAAHDGTLAISSPAGGPTVVRAVIPCGQ